MNVKAYVTLMYRSTVVTWNLIKGLGEVSNGTMIPWKPHAITDKEEDSVFYHCGWVRKNCASGNSFPALLLE